ncbi:MAG TPA: MFS transporter [Mycobacteriales bacterium]|nr:MFS transporter [Mycobacteriales bacterium]
MTAPRPSRSLFRHRDFMLLWSGQSISEIGSSVTQLALPLLAVITLQASTFEVGILTACTTLAFLLVALPAGAWIDRWRRKPVLVWGDAGRVVLLGSIPLAKATGHLTLAQLYVVALATGVLTVFFDVAYQAYLPALVHKDQLVDGNGKIGTTQSFAQVAGPSVGGALVGALGAAYAIVVDAASFGVSTIATSLIRKKEPAPTPKADRQRLRDDIREGLRFVLDHPILKKIVGCTGTSNFFSAMMFAVEAVFLVRVLHATPAIIGVVFSLGSIGGLLGGLTAGRLAKRFGSARIIWLSQLWSAPFAVLTPLAFRGWGVGLVAVSLFANSFMAVVYNVAQVSYRQSICPPELQGRMNASVRFIVWGTQPLGGVAGGVLGAAIGVRPTAWVAAVGGSLAVIWVLASPLLTMRDVPGSEPEEPGPPQEMLPPGQEPLVPAALTGAGEPGAG